MTGRVDDGLQPLPCQVLNGLPDHRLVAESPAGQLQPGPVQRPLKLLGCGVGRGGRQVFKGTVCLLRPGIEQIDQSGGVVGVSRSQTRCLVNLIVIVQCLLAGFLEQGIDLPLGFPGEPLKVVVDVLAACP